MRFCLFGKDKLYRLESGKYAPTMGESFSAKDWRAMLAPVRLVQRRRWRAQRRQRKQPQRLKECGAKPARQRKQRHATLRNLDWVAGVAFTA